MNHDYIQSHKKDWAYEFASEFASLDANDSALEEVVSMAAHTILYEIADGFRGGNFREEIIEYIKGKNA